MNKYLKTIVGIFVIIILILLLSPFISLLLPEKFTNRTYYRLLYHVIVEEETGGCQNNEEKVIKLFQYVVNHEFLQGVPYKCKPAESLIYAEAYCDFQARTLNALLGVDGILSRYANLMDKDRIARHTLNEVFLDNKWAVLDTSTNIIFRDTKGNKLSLQEMSEETSFIYNQEKIIILKEYDKTVYDHFLNWHSRMFPMPVEPGRSTPIMLQSHVFDYIADIYFKILKYNFFNPYQDFYLKFKKKYSGKKDFRLFFMARNYHLAYRKDLALKYYNLLLERYPQSSYVEDATFFCGILYFDMQNFQKSIELFKLIIDKYSIKWRSAAYYYLGRAHNLIGDKEASLEAYDNTDRYKLSEQILKDLNNRRLQKN